MHSGSNQFVVLDQTKTTQINKSAQALTTMPLQFLDTNSNKSLCKNSELSEKIAFSFLGFKDENRIVSEHLLSKLYPRRRVPDSIFETEEGNVAVEVKRVKNVMHQDTVINALEKIYLDIVSDFNIKYYHIVFQTRGSGSRDKVNNVVRDVHGIMRKFVSKAPYQTKNGVRVFVHVQKVGELPFMNIGY